MIVLTRPGVGPFTAGDVPSERSQQPSWSWLSGHKEPDPSRPRWPRRQQQTPLHRPPKRHLGAHRPRGPRRPPVVPRDPGTNLTASPPPPTLTTSPEQYRTAEAVATQYLQVWCWQPAAAPANSNLTNTAPWITPAGQADDLTRSATSLPSLTSICGPVTVTQIGEQPSAPDRTLLQLSTRQAYINTSGVIVSQQTIEQTRRIVRGPDGRWLVDTQVQAG